MIVQVRGGGEALATHLALMRFLPRMDPSVGVEGAGCAECLATDVTCMGLLP